MTLCDIETSNRDTRGPVLNSRMEDMYRDVFHLGNFTPERPAHGYGPAGSMCAFSDERGRGEYWTHFHGGMFAVNAFEMTFEERGTLQYKHAEHMSICLYEDVHDVEVRGFQMRPGAVSVYIAEEGGEYAARYGCGARMKGTSITVSPRYYRDYLEGRFGPIPDVRRAFARMDGHDFPAMVSLLRRMRGYRGDGMAASLFYEGAVAEAMGLMMGHAVGADGGLATSDEDLVALDELGVYLSGHLDQQMTVESMAKLACMGLTKFKLAFKSRYGRTPASYVHALRMERARELLASTDMPVSAVARQVGYRSASSFTQAFRRFEGVLPSDCRDGGRR